MSCIPGSAVAQALVDSGIASQTDGVYTVDMAKLTEAIEAGMAWADIGLPQLYGSITVGTTDPTKSNSGNMFAGPFGQHPLRRRGRRKQSG